MNVVIEQQDHSLGFDLSANFPPHVVTNVKPDGHAARNGLRTGDILVFIGGVDVQRKSQDELLDYLASVTEERSVSALVFRNGWFSLLHCNYQFSTSFIVSSLERNTVWSGAI